MNMISPRTDFVDEAFINACRDYYYLIDRGFPEKGVLKLTGDRYRLTGDQRTVLYRGIASGKRSMERKKLLTEEVSGKRLLIDGYNVLFTLINYRFGKILFISTDYILRDAGALHGRLRDFSIFESCIGLLVGYLAVKDPSEVDIYLDSPVSHSEKHAFLITGMLGEKGISGACHVVRSADWPLRHGTECVIATSDTGIIDKASLPVADISRAILEQNYHAVFPEINRLLAPDKTQDTVDES